MTRKTANILITGTPGTGKSSLAETLLHNVDGLKHLNISEIVKERKLGSHFNQEWQAWEFSDDKARTRSKNTCYIKHCQSNDSSWTALRTKSKTAAVSLISILASCFQSGGLTLWWFCKRTIQYCGIDLRGGIC